jgi:hypothetical protein
MTRVDRSSLFVEATRKGLRANNLALAVHLFTVRKDRTPVSSHRILNPEDFLNLPQLTRDTHIHLWHKIDQKLIGRSLRE